jgi:hypothetical protein
MSMPWGFCWSTLDEPWVFNPPTLRRTHTSMRMTQQMVPLSGPEGFVLNDEGKE